MSWVNDTSTGRVRRSQVLVGLATEADKTRPDASAATALHSILQHPDGLIKKEGGCKLRCLGSY
jgi:hypothetical protein